MALKAQPIVCNIKLLKKLARDWSIHFLGLYGLETSGSADTKLGEANKMFVDFVSEDEIQVLVISKKS